AQLLDARLLSGVHACRDTVLGVHAPVVLHIATHGYSAKTDDTLLLQWAGRFDPSMLGYQRDPLSLSGLALAGANWKADIIRRLASQSDDRYADPRARDVGTGGVEDEGQHAVDRLVAWKRTQGVVTERILAVLECTKGDAVGDAAWGFAYPPAAAGDGR